MSCRNIPREAVDGFETLPEMYLGLGVRRDGATGVAQGADQDAPEQGIDLSALRDRDALECFNRLIASNPSLLRNTAAALQIIRHFQTTDGVDPHHVTWNELTRDYGANAEAVAHQINAYLGIVTFLSQSSDAPAFPARDPARAGSCPNVTAQALASYEDLAQAYVGLGIDRDAMSGVSQRALAVTPQDGLDLSVLDDADAVAYLEGMAKNNPSFARDLHRVQQILAGLREIDPIHPGTLTFDEVRNLYGDSAGQVLVSINAYLGLLHRIRGTPRENESKGSNTGVNPLTVAKAALVLLIGVGVYFGFRRRRNNREVVRLPIPKNTVGEIRVPFRNGEIRRDFGGRFSVRVREGSESIMVYRTDVGKSRSEQVPVLHGAEVFLFSGDVIRFGRHHYRFTTPAIGPVLVKVKSPSQPSATDPIQPVAVIQERTLIDRLSEAQREGRPVELFVSAEKAKYAGQITNANVPAGFVSIRNGDSREVTLRLDQIVTVRGRGDTDDLTSLYSRVSNPQFRDKSYNHQGILHDFQVLVDYGDPRLTGWIEHHIQPIRDRLDRGELTQRQAAEDIRRIVEEEIPYDHSRYDKGIERAPLPRQLFRLGDFTQTGICNERGMLVQVALQYLGIESRWTTGHVDGGERHAWVVADVAEPGKPPIQLILDPQESRSYEKGRDPKAMLFKEDGISNIDSSHRTVVLSDPPPALPSFSRFRSVPLYDGDFHQALIEIDPSGRLAKAYRRISPEAHPARTVGELLDKAKNAHPHLAAEFENAFERTGSTPWKALFQIAGKLADEAERSKGFRRRHSGAVGPRERAALALDFERRMGGSEHERNSPRRPAERRDRVEREHMEGRRPGRGRP